MRVIIKTEVRKMIFGHAVIAWIFFLIFYYCKILNFGLLKVRFRQNKQKDVKDDGISSFDSPQPIKCPVSDVNFPSSSQPYVCTKGGRGGHLGAN